MQPNTDHILSAAQLFYYVIVPCGVLCAGAAGFVRSAVKKESLKLQLLIAQFKLELSNVYVKKEDCTEHRTNTVLQFTAIKELLKAKPKHQVG